MVVIWTPRPWERVLWLVAVAGIACQFTCLSNQRICGHRIGGIPRVKLSAPWACARRNFLRSLWVVGVALALAAVALIRRGSTKRLSSSRCRQPHMKAACLVFFKTFWSYALWTFVQQFLLQGFFSLRLLRIIPSPRTAGLCGSGPVRSGASAHPVLAPLTLVWGFAPAWFFFATGTCYPLAIAHAIFGISIAITVPVRWCGTLRVGPRLSSATTTRDRLLQPQGPDGVH